MFAPTAVTDHARLEMICQQLDPKSVERGTHRGDLIQDIDTITVVIDHPLDSSDLAGDPLDPRFQLGGLPCFHSRHYTPVWYTSINLRNQKSCPLRRPTIGGDLGADAKNRDSLASLFHIIFVDG